jgi:hypothetical protein
VVTGTKWDPYIILQTAKSRGVLLTGINNTAKTDVYHAQVQAKVRLEDPAQPLFDISTVFHPNQDQCRNSLTCIMSLDRINTVRVTTAAEMNKIYDLQSRDKKREYKLQQFSLSELVSDLWWLNNTKTNKKERETST